MHVLHMAKHQIGQCRRWAKFGHSYVPGNHPQDGINWFKKKT